MKLNWGILYIIIASIFVSSCSSFTKIQRRGTFEEKYAAAKEYYQKADYYRAGTLFDQIFPFSIGTPVADTIHILNAYCQYYQGALFFAAQNFKSFYQKYPRSARAEEANYMFSRCLYETSAPVNLDQQSTKDAINAFQDFLANYPNSSYQDESLEIIQRMQEKLEMKAYLLAKMQLKIHHYRGAVVSIDNFKKDYPSSKFLEELAYTRLNAQYLFGKFSVERIKKDGETYHLKSDRLIKAKKFYYQFIDNYPSSPFVKKAELLLTEIETEYNSLKYK